MVGAHIAQFLRADDLKKTGVRRARRLALPEITSKIYLSVLQYCMKKKFEFRYDTPRIFAYLVHLIVEVKTG